MSRMSEGISRPKIFEDWPKNPMKFHQSIALPKYRGDKKNQSVRAEQTLQRSMMILVNIKNFIAQKERIEQTYGMYAQKSDRCKKQLQALSMERGVPFEIGEYENSLRNYYLVIRNESKFVRQAQGFCLSNLANYDPKVTGIKYTRPKGQSQKQLLLKVNELQQKRMRLQQSLVVYEQNMQRSEILGNQFDLQTCLQDLNRYISDEKLTEIHYLMLYQVNEMNEEFNKFSKRVSEDKQNYATYQALCDSMNLMQYHQKQMKKDRKQLKRTFQMLNMETAPQIIPVANQSLTILLKNQSVYESNVDLLARYNAETNLNEYSSRRQNYSNQLGKYKSYLRKWKKEQEVSSFLYTKQVILGNYNKKRAIENSQALANKEKQQLKQSYVDIINCQVPPNANQIQNYRLSLLQEYGNTMKKQGIVIPEGTQLLVSNMKSLRNPNEQFRFQKYLDFFMQLKQQPIKNKALFLVSQKSNINALLYELNQYQNDSVLANQYETGLKYCNAISDHSTTFQDRQYIGKTQQISKQRWTGLPIGLNSPLFNYTCDVLVKSQAEYYISQIFSPRMSEIEQSISRELQNNGGQRQVTQIAQLKLNLTPQERRQFFFTYYHKISDYSERSKKKLFDDYWKVAAAHIINAYRKSKVNSSSSKTGINEVNKKDFFTFQTLSYLAVQGNRLKISNFPNTIEYYLDYLDKYDNYRFDQNQMFLEIVKQRIFIQFLKQKITNNNMNLSQELMVMEKMNQACVLLYQINDHAQFVNKQDIQTHFQHSIKLQKAQNELLESFPQGESSDLVRKMKSKVKNIRKNPIIMGSQMSLRNLELLVNTNGKLRKFEKINNLKPNLGFVSTAYTRSQNVLQTIQNLNSFTFNKSDIVTLGQDESKYLYIAELQKKANELFILKPQLDEIMGIYQGELSQSNINRQNYSNLRSSGYQSNSQATLQEIINKLRRMNWKN